MIRIFYPPPAKPRRRIVHKRPARVDPSARYTLTQRGWELGASL